MTIEQARNMVEYNEDDFYALILFDFWMAMHPDADPERVAETVIAVYERNQI